MGPQVDHTPPIEPAAACKARGISYSKVIGELKKHKVDLNRKMLADLALTDAKAFGRIVDLVKK